MPDLIGPYDAAAGWWTQDAWYRVARAWSPSGVLSAPASALTSGPFAVTSSGLNVTVAVGTAWIRGGGFGPAAVTPLTVTANPHASFARRDRIVIRRDLAAQTTTLEVKLGTASGSPVAPGLTQDDNGIWEETIASFLVPANNGTTLSGFVDERTWVDPGGLGKLQQRLWTFGRTGNASDSFASGSYIVVFGATVANAPAGDYAITSRLVVSNTGDASGFQRTLANATAIGPSDPRADCIGNSRMAFVQSGGYTHTGGSLTVNQYYNAVSGTPTVWSQGTEVSISYLGPR